MRCAKNWEREKKAIRQTIIEKCAFAFAKQGIAEPLSGDEGTELVTIKKPRNTTMSYTPKNMNMKLSVGEPSRQMHNIEKTVQFGLLKSSSSPLNDGVQLANRIPLKGCTEIKAAASQNGKYAYSNPTQVSVHCVHAQRRASAGGRGKGGSPISR